jgi:hypothetical protein
MKSKATPKQVFLSHARNDRTIADSLAEELRRQEINVWYDQSISPGEDWPEEIKKALNACDSMIAILHQHSFSSSYVRNELEHAFFDDRYKGRLLPVLIGPSSDADFARLPWVLTKMKYLRITEKQSPERIAKTIAREFIDLLKAQEGHQ